MREGAVPDPKPGESRSFAFTSDLGAPGESVLSLQETDPAGPSDLGRRGPDPSDDEAAVRVVHQRPSSKTIGW